MPMSNDEPASHATPLTLSQRRWACARRPRKPFHHALPREQRSISPSLAAGSKAPIKHLSIPRPETGARLCPPLCDPNPTACNTGTLPTFCSRCSRRACARRSSRSVPGRGGRLEITTNGCACGIDEPLCCCALPTQAMSVAARQKQDALPTLTSQVPLHHCQRSKIKAP